MTFQFKKIMLPGSAKGYDTGINLTIGQRLTVIADGRISPYPNQPDPEHYPPSQWREWFGPDGDSNNESNFPCPPVNSTLPEMVLMGNIGSGTYFEVGKNFDQPVTSAGRLYLTLNDCNGLFFDNRGYFHVVIIIDAPDESDNDSSCEAGGYYNEVASQNPIQLRTANKIMSETDFTVNSPTGKLLFTRSFRQDRLPDSDYQFMGLGWSHNHRYTLQFSGTSPNREAVVNLPDGGYIKLDEDGVGGHFDARAGASATLEHDGTNNQYVLTTSSKATFVFSDVSPYLLEKRTFPNGEELTYTYSGNDLTKVEDGYGREINLSYYSTGDYKDGRLWRVGDHTATDLNTGSPGGRYIELDYTSEKSNGTVVASPKALLETIKDVRGNTWTYDYYGQDSGESDAHQLNFMLKRQSPSVDTDGDGTADGVLTLEDLTYTLDGSGNITQIDQERGAGLIDTQFRFQPNGDNITEAETAGQIVTHHFANGVYVGQADANGNLPWQALGDNYRTQGTSDANGNQTDLTWSTGGKHLEAVSDAAGNNTSFNYDTQDRLTDTTDAQGRKTEYTYGDTNNPRQPTVIKVLDTDSTTVLRHQEFVYDGKGRTTEEKTIAPDDGTTVLRQTTRVYGTSGNENGLLRTQTENTHLPPADQRKTEYTYDSVGRVVKTYKTSMFGTCEYNYTVYDDAGNVLGSACSRYQTTTLPTTQQDLRDVYTVAPDRTTVTLYEYDALGRRIKVITNAESPFEQTNLTFYDALDRVHLQINNFVGLPSDQPGLWRWREVNGQWGWYKPDDTLVNQGNNHIQNIITATSYNASGLVEIQRASTGTANYTVYDDANRPIRSITHYIDQDGVDPANWYWNGTKWQYDNPNAIDVNHGIHNDQNLITERVHDPSGNVVKQIGVDRQVTLVGYDALNRVVKTIRVASDPDYDFNADRELANYVPGSAVDNDRISTTTYDALGQVVTQTDDAGRTTYTVYDELGRSVRSISNYIPQGTTNPADWHWDDDHSNWQRSSTDTMLIDQGSDNDQNLINDTVYDSATGRVEFTYDNQYTPTRPIYDSQDRAVGTVRNYVQQGSTDPNDWHWNGTNWQYSSTDATAIEHGTDNTKNIIERRYYNDDGQVRSSVNVIGYWTLNHYDTAGRLVKTIDKASDPNASNLENYTPSLDPDQDLISEFTYDVIGRRIKAWHLLENRAGTEVWTTTLYGYDILNRQIKTITNASQPDYDMTTDADLSGYTESTQPDEDIITETTYDAQGRVEYPIDVNDSKNYMVYDGLGRQIMTVSNYQSGTPDSWTWNTNQWEDAGSIAIAHGDNDDENIVSQTHYDSDGRVRWTRNVLGRRTYTVYDAQGRQVRTIRNYVEQGATDPADWVWNTTSDRWEQGASDSTAIVHGTNDDLNQITETVYNDLGQVQQTLDVRRNVTYNVYDNVGRRVMTIGNYVKQGGTDPADWVWANNQWEDGNNNPIQFGDDFTQNRITHTTYDRVGRVVETRNPAGIITHNTYDDLGRRVETVQNYVNGVFDTLSPDEDLISQTVYNQAGQVVKTVDARGTETSFTYDHAGRRVMVTQASNTSLAVSIYTCYDKAGRVLRTIQGYVPLYDENDQLISPDAWDAGAWVFDPTVHGYNADQNRITEYIYDKASRRTVVTDPLGNQTTTTYSKDGQVESVTDLEGTVTQYRYDGLRRRNLVVQGFVDNGTDPAAWVWNASRYEESDSDPTAIVHGTNNDQNIIVQVTHDLVGRMTSLRDPRGNLTSYGYDQLNRRTSLTNPQSNNWTTAYVNLTTGGSRQTMTYPGVNGTGSYDVVRDFDPLGRLKSITFNDPTTTPDVDFGYDIVGNRTSMTEYDNVAHTSITPKTTFAYDGVRRLTDVDFDTDGDGNVEETVSYEYDAGGLRTKMTLPGNPSNLDITYGYDAREQLISVTDWDSQATNYAYDNAGRHIAPPDPTGSVVVIATTSRRG